MKIKLLLAVFAVTAVFVACGPDWNDCGTCSVTPPPPTPVVDSGTPTTPEPDAGQPTPDAGTPPCDAGTPPKKVCENVCTCYAYKYECSNNLTYDYDASADCHSTCKKVKYCTKTERVCHEVP